MLMGHLDVVPSTTSLDRWTHPPFSGTIDGEWIYGRGSSDCKNNVIGILTAVEHLLISGWTPRRTLVLSFGQDEEISGPQGAQNIGPYLENLFGKNGIAMIIDEGGMGLESLYGTEFALPGIAEKGHADFHIEVDMLGGHASVPSQHTSIGILSKIVSSIEDSDVFQPTLRQESPLWGYLSCLARHGNPSEVPPWIKKAVFEKNPDMAAAAAEFAQISLVNRYLIQTSKAATVFNAGVKNNALAESAVVNFNTRIEIFSTPEEVRNAYLALIRPVAKRYSLLLNGQSLASEPSIGNITFGWSDVQSPTPISPLTSTAWAIFSKSVQASFGPGVISAPSAMTGNTDTRFYVSFIQALTIKFLTCCHVHQLNLTRNIYRWSPARIGTRLNAHTVDEMISP
ncbi:hypothetical protein BD779DRAFT_542480 [Infundibulicybe gibba]|nr:hypothetical protein BD779DRAFT_542480 [Infundibulicybe gibba]